MKSWIAALAVFAACGQASAACVLNRLAELPVTMSGLRPTIPAKIEGHDIRLLVDSGAFFSILSPGAAAELKLKTQPAPFGFLIEGVGGDAIPSMTTVRRFELDTIPMQEASFLVAGSEAGPGLSGLLGRNILNLVDAEYDLANGVIRLMRPVGCGGRELAYWSGAQAYSDVPMVLVANQRFPEIQVIVKVNGVDLRAILDTGAAGSVLTKAAATRAGVPTSGPGVTGFGVSSGIGRRQVRSFLAPVLSFKIGDEEIKNTRIRVLDASFDGSDLLLGADFFLAHRVFVANDRHRIYFTYNGGSVFSLAAKPLEGAATSGGDAASTPASSSLDSTLPTDAAGFSRRGGASASRRDYPAALADLDRAVAMAPDNPDYLYQRATLRLANGQVFLAMADIEQTLKLRPRNPDALITRAELRFLGHDRAGAFADLETAAASIGPAADSRLHLAELYARWDCLADAVAQASFWIAAHADDSRHWEALSLRCRARALLNTDLDKALADCEAARRMQPNNARVLDNLGLTQLRLTHYAKAIEDYTAALALRPKAAWTLQGRGLAKLAAGDASGGQADLAAAAAIEPKMAAVAARYGLKPATQP